MIKNRDYLNLEYINEQKLKDFISRYSKPDFICTHVDLYSRKLHETISFKLYNISENMNMSLYVKDTNPIIIRHMGMSGYLPHKFIDYGIPQVSIYLAQNEYGLNLYNSMYSKSPHEREAYYTRMRKTEQILKRSIFF